MADASPAHFVAMKKVLRARCLSVLYWHLTSRCQREPKRWQARCSNNRDICYAVIRKTTTGAYWLSLSMFEGYFPHYRLCVQPIGGRALCRGFRVRPSGVYSPKVGWLRQFAAVLLGARPPPLPRDVAT